MTTERLFDYGVGAGGVLLLVAAVATVAGTSDALLSMPVLLSYDVAACIHVVWLGVLVGRERPQTPALDASMLYTCGFIHTLLAIGLALLGTAAALLAQNQIAIEDTLRVIAPLGAAVLPHAIAVWRGFKIERTSLRATDGRDEFFRALAADAQKANESLDELYRRRAEATENEIRELAALTRKIANLGQAAEKSLNIATSTMNSVGEEGQNVVREARAQVGELAKTLNTSSRAMATDVQRATAALAAVSKEAASLAGAIGGAVPNAELTAERLREAAVTVQKLNELQRAIVDLLSAPLFQKVS